MERIEILLRGSATDDNENEEGISYFIRDVILVMILPLMKIVIHVCYKIIIYSCYNDDFDFYFYDGGVQSDDYDTYNYCCHC